MRFIPMRMGNMCSMRPSKSLITVHPHAYGEHIMMLDEEEKETGSSPCVWGTFPPVIHPALYRRFIPMRMGNISTTC